MVLVLAPSGGFRAAIDTPFVVRVDVEELKAYQIARAEIELPHGVFFYSQKYPEIQDQRSLALAWNAEINNTQLPFIIRSSETGSKIVTVRFFDFEGRIVATRELKINFKS